MQLPVHPGAGSTAGAPVQSARGTCTQKPRLRQDWLRGVSDGRLHLMLMRMCRQSDSFECCPYCTGTLHATRFTSTVSEFRERPADILWQTSYLYPACVGFPSVCSPSRHACLGCKTCASKPSATTPRPSTPYPGACAPLEHKCILAIERHKPACERRFMTHHQSSDPHNRWTI